MEKRWYLLIVTVFLLLFLSACQEKEEQVKPADVFNKYVELWNEQKFDDMYDMLSDAAKEMISKEDFTGRYEKIYGDIGVENLQVSFEEETLALLSEEEMEGTESYTIPFSVSMDTIAGPIEFDQEAELIKVIVNEEEGEIDWLVNWNTGFIFAGMKPEDKVGMSFNEPTRGEIIDRNGNGLALNGEVYELGLVPQDLGEDPGAIKQEVAEMLGISVESIDNKLGASWVQPHYYVPIKRIPQTEEALAYELQKIPGVQVRTVQSRVYPLGEAAAHLIGYVDEVTAEDLENFEGYQTGDVIGKRGLEQLFEKELKGESGLEIYIEKPDATKVLLAENPTRNGETIQLTIDSSLQLEMLEQFKGKAGTGVAIHPQTGETLALVSSPSFDPNDYMFMTPAQRQEIVEAPLQPLLNRFVLPHTPGSVMKPFTAAIALENGTITSELTRDIKTRQWQKDNSWGGYKITRVTDPGRPVNLRDALVFSDNIYFAQTGLEMGASKFIDGLKQFGFGEDIPFTYPLQASKISNDGNLSNEILLADSAYGQGQVQTNIVHLAAGYTAFVNNGSIVKPVLLKDEEASSMWKESIITEETVRIVSENMRAVVADERGTGHVANLPNIALAGKTGTAEAGKSEQGAQAVENGWFVAYDYDQQDLLVAMTMESIQDEEHSIVVKAVRALFE